MQHSTSAIRARFLQFFADRGHQTVASSPLVPGNDPTLLFTNAGMVPFKDVFLGREPRDYTRATSSQRCVRAGGKHNDLENVGYTARHHTFFEMLGNFSFGDYFKKDAIHYAWDFLTKELNLPAEKLWVTVFEEDDEAADIWLNDVGVSETRFSRIGAKDNFWQMGDTGPCGPCTEIFYDHGEQVPGGPPGTPEEDGDRYIEIWNLVFMQYNRDADGTLNPLPKPSVDTGMGLERLAAVLQGVHANYEIDLFVNLLAAAQQVTGAKAADSSSLRVIADHIRSTAFLIADGVLPSNEGRGYVLRRIIRRAIRHGYKLGQKQVFFYRLVAPLVAEMGEAYPELAKQQAHVERILQTEEERFRETLEQGMKLLEADLQTLDNDVIPGDTVFKLYDTYGFPMDLTADIARERGLQVDEAGFEAAMSVQRDNSRQASNFGVDYNDNVEVDTVTSFYGYDRLQHAGKVAAIILNGERVERLAAGETGAVILDETPFYAESGGQQGDAGSLLAEQAEFAVADTQKQGAAAHAHIGTVKRGALQVGDAVNAVVDIERRHAIVLNHSATHLMHAALRQILGEHVSQKGSLVAPDRLRFDFAHYQPLTAVEMQQVEQRVNQEVRRNVSAEANEMSYDAAIDAGAMALFGEKYGDQVRVLSMGEFSTELCGGTHVERTGDIGAFKIIAETGVASGVRRIEAVTGAAALAWYDEQLAKLDGIAGLVKSGRDDVLQKVTAVTEKSKQLEKDIAQLKAQQASSAGADLAGQAIDIQGIKVLAADLSGVDAKSLRDTVDQLKNKLGTAAIVLSAVEDEKIRLVAGVTADATDRIKAGALVNHVAMQVGGKGGGRPDMAQAGGTEPSKLPAALATVNDWVQSQL